MSDLIKKAIEVIQTFDKRVRQPHFPNAANRMSSSIKLDAATSLAKAMELGARHGALSNTRVELNGTKLNDIGARVKANPRNSASYKRNFTNPYGKVVDNMDAEGEYSIDEEGNLVKSFEGPKSEASQEFGDAYHTTADNVWLPSGNPGVMMHELGHAIDFNEYPKDSFMRRGIASTYKALAPTLWTEHAAWRKGKDRLLTGAAKSKLNPELLVKTLEQAARTRPMGLGSYWGRDIGGVLGAATGGAAGLAGGLLLSDAFGNSRGSVRAAGRFTGLGLLLGGALGAMGGASLGSSWGKSYGEKDSLGDEKAVQKYMNEYARAYSREYNVPQDEALRQIEALRETIKAKVKNKQTAGAKSMGSLQKAAAFGAMMGKKAALAPAAPAAPAPAPLAPTPAPTPAPAPTPTPAPNNSNFTLKPNSEAEFSLRPMLEQAYSKVPGGLNKAVSEAQKYQTQAKDNGLVTWKPSALDKPISVSNTASSWGKAMGNRSGSSTGGLTQGTTSVMMNDTNRKDGRIAINPGMGGRDNSERLGTLRHEMSHAALHDGSTVMGSVLKPGDMARVNVPENKLKYLTRPEEFKAHLAEVKRENAERGILIDTPEKARKALEEAAANPGNDMLKGSLPEFMKNKTFMDKAILQLLSVVKGDSMQPKGGYA